MRRARWVCAALCLAAAAAATAQTRSRVGPFSSASLSAVPRDAAGELARAEALRRAGRKQEAPAARALYRAAIEAFRAARDGCGLRRALVALSGFEHDNGNTPEQKSAAQDALRARCAADVAQQALAERLLGSAYINSGDYAAGARETERAVALFRRAGDAPGETVALRNLGLAYEESGELGKALATTRLALAGAERSGDMSLLALIRNDMALTYSARGEFARAIEAYRKSLASLETHPNPTAEAVAWVNLGVAYGQLGDAEQAEAAYERGEVAATRADCASCLAEIQVDRGDDWLDAGAPARAAAAYRLALAIATPHQLVRQRAEALRGLGRWAIASRRWIEARRQLDAARDALRGTSERLNQSLIDIALGDLDDRMGRIVPARRDYGRALHRARSAANETWQAAALASLARVELESGELVRARRSIGAAVALIESERSRIDAPGLRTSYFGTKRAYYGLYIDILMQLERDRPGRGYAAQALAVAERARARALQDELRARAIDVGHHVAPELLAAESAAADRLHAIAWQLSQANPSDEARRSALQRELDQASHELDEARGRIRAADPRYAELLHPAALTLEEIQRRLLDRDASALEYWLGERRSYLWVLSADAVRSFALPGRSLIDAAAADLHATLLAPAVSSVPIEQRTSFEGRSAVAARVSADHLERLILPQGARPLLRSVIAVVPDGGLAGVPFAVLRDGPASTYVYLPSLGTLRGLRSLPPATAPRHAVAVLADPVFRPDDVRLRGRATVEGARPARTADANASIESSGTANALRGTSSPDALVLRAADEAGVAALPRLPYTREEAQAIQAFADRRDSWVALDFAASRRAALEARWSDFSIVHFATHALLNMRDPELSGIVLSLYDRNGTPEDGFLRASDIYALDMPVDLVVLSVCDSAVGKEVGAEGPANLARALFYAGAHRVLASLWAVDDRASVELMRAFYRSLLERAEPATQALADAQRALRRNPRWRLPYYWAAYVLEGDWR